MFRAYTAFLLGRRASSSCSGMPYLRFLSSVATRGPEVSGHIQSLVIAQHAGLFGIVLVVPRMLADLLSVNRKLMEDLLLRVKRLRVRRRGRRRRGRRPRAGPAR